MQNFILKTLFITALCGSNAAQAFDLPFSGPGNYAECVFANLNSNVPPQAVRSVESNCRQRHPRASSSFAEPSSLQACYSKQQHRASSRRAAEAIFIACQDYFR